MASRPSYETQLSPGDVPMYVPQDYAPARPRTRTRGSSAASKYTPEGYEVSARPSNTGTPPSDSRPQANGRPFTPSNPEQYRAPPSAGSGLVPPAQLSPFYQEPAHAPSALPPYIQPRSSSVTSYHSERSHRSHRSSPSHRSAHSHRSSDAGRDREHRHREDHEQDREERHHKRRRSGQNSETEFGKPLHRKSTIRSYGNSLFAIFDGIKASLKGS